MAKGDELFLSRLLGGLVGAAMSSTPVGRVTAPLNASAQKRVGKAAREGGRVWNTLTRPGASGERFPGGDMGGNGGGFLEAAMADREPRGPVNFDAGVVYIPGPAQNNAMLVRTPENIEAFLAQTQEEHDAALDKYMNDPNIPPERAVRLGERAEQQLPKWWNDKDPRLPVTPSSSCVKSARIGPDGDIYVTFGSNPNKEYQYEGSPDPVEASKVLQQLVTADSIGRAVNSWTGDWGTAHTYLPKG